MNKKLTIVYGLDNKDQFYQLETSLISLNRVYQSNIDVLIFVSNEDQKESLKNIIDSLKSEIEYKIVIIKEFDGKPKKGMFYWFFAPYYSNSDYLLQVDNDIVFNCNLQDFISMGEKMNTTFSAVKIRFSEKANVVKTLSSKFNIEINKKFMKQWINAGVVLINSKKFKDKFNLESDLVRELNNYMYNNTKIKDTEFVVSDEGFLLSKFPNEIGSLNRRYNTRIHSPFSTFYNIKKNDYIFHYNKKMLLNSKWSKIDFRKLVKDKEYSDSVKKAIKEDITKNNIKHPKNYSDTLIDNLIKDYNGIY